VPKGLKRGGGGDTTLRRRGERRAEPLRELRAGGGDALGSPAPEPTAQKRNQTYVLVTKWSRGRFAVGACIGAW
jgi:hypothetical protein